MATMKELDAWVLKGGPGYYLTKAQAKDYRSKPSKERRRIAESLERDVWMKRDPKMKQHLAEELKKDYGPPYLRQYKKRWREHEMDSAKKLRDLEAKHRNLFR